MTADIFSLPANVFVVQLNRARSSVAYRFCRTQIIADVTTLPAAERLNAARGFIASLRLTSHDWLRAALNADLYEMLGESR